MARETKQDRIVRTMLDQAMEHLHEIKSIEGNPHAKELDVERWCQSFLKSCLGYTASGGYTIRAQEMKGKMRPDLIILKGDKPVFVVEVKKLGYNLNKTDFRSGKIQLNEYLHSIGNVRWGMLTNGIEWKLFDFSQPGYGGIEVCSFDLKSEGDELDTSKKSVEEQCYELMDFHESSFDDSYWPELSKEAMAFSPESLARAIMSVDVIKYISRTIKGEHEYKANHEVLTDRVYWLLEQGLNDAISGWNETKVAELQKYIKAQKRASRKTRKSRKTDMPASEATLPPSHAGTLPTTTSTLDNKKGVA